MMITGYSIKKYPVYDMNCHTGYNTPISRRSQEHWIYAQSIATIVFMKMGKDSLIISIILSFGFLIFDINIVFSICIAIIEGFIFLIIEKKGKDKF